MNRSIKKIPVTHSQTGHILKQPSLLNSVQLNKQRRVCKENGENSGHLAKPVLCLPLLTVPVHCAYDLVPVVPVSFVL